MHFSIQQGVGGLLYSVQDKMQFAVGSKLL
jgi:hypothetical protein